MPLTPASRRPLSAEWQKSEALSGDGLLSEPVAEGEVGARSLAIHQAGPGGAEVFESELPFHTHAQFMGEVLRV